MARTSSYNNMVGTEFEGAGFGAGVELWRISKRKLLRQPPDSPECQGQFYDKECYVILSTVPKDDAAGFLWGIHTWKGKDASMVTSGFAGSMANKLNNLLTSNANQVKPPHRS